MLLLSSLLKLFILCFDKLLGTDVLFDANHRFVPFNFLFSIFSVIVQLCLVILFPVYLTENLSSIFSHKGFVHLRDSNMLFFFFKPYSPSVTISSDIKLYYPLLFPPTFGRRDCFPISPLIAYDKKCIKFFINFQCRRIIKHAPKCLDLPFVYVTDAVGRMGELSTEL